MLLNKENDPIYLPIFHDVVDGGCNLIVAGDGKGGLNKISEDE